ncbi:hypothetical protein VPH35_085291 [Triticum aestivum]
MSLFTHYSSQYMPCHFRLAHRKGRRCPSIIFYPEEKKSDGGYPTTTSFHCRDLAVCPTAALNYHAAVGQIIARQPCLIMIMKLLRGVQVHSSVLIRRVCTQETLPMFHALAV